MKDWLKRLPAGTFQFLIFLVVAAIVIPFGINYVAGPEGFGSKIRLHAEMDDAFGLNPGTGVTMRGVDIGTVTKAGLSSNGQKAEVEFVVRGDSKIPRNSFMQVTMGSMAGIQSVDIIPQTAGGPYLKDGDKIAAPEDKQPMQMDTIIAKAAGVLETFKDGTVSTLGNELYAAFGENNEALAKLTTNGAELAKMVRNNAPMLKGLLGDWISVLGAMADTTDSFEAGMRSAASFTDQLDANQPVFIYLVDQSPAALEHATGLFDKYRGTFGGVLANLAVVEPIVSDRQAALQTGLKTIPQGLYDLRSIVKNNRADFALVGTFGPVCLFYDEPRRAIGDVSESQPNLARYCPPGNGHGQRGAVNAPRPNDLGTENWKYPGGVAGPAVSEDPLLVPDGAELLQLWKELLERTREGN